ncbi:MAG: SDR family oxidoreductase [Desulfurivibrionaceae bacterium]|nr:SDR family oxidoreductase [Desulfurivibrionaceae bacterium]
MEISGKTALVLGASRGLGRAVALALGEAGARLILPYYDWPDSVREMQEDFCRRGFDFLALPADLRHQEEVRELLHQGLGRYGRLDIVINNIERGGMPVVHGPYTREQWEVEMATTLKAKWNVFQESLPWLQEQSEAVMIVISSIAGLTGRTGPAGLLFNDGYAAANRAVSALTETWAREGAPKVRVNEIMLGFFEQRHAQQTRGWPLLQRSQQQEILDHTLLGRTGTSQDLVAAVFFLLTGAAFMTGSTLRLDGGYLLGGEKIPPMPAGLGGDLAIKR